MSTVPGASKRERTKRAAGLAAVAVEPANLQTMALADRPSRRPGSAASAACRTASAARSMSGKLLWRVSCQTRISSCANWRPVVPVCDSSSGSAFCSSSCENKNAGSSGMASRPPRSRCAGSHLDLGVLVQEPARILAEDAGQHLQHLGRGHALAGLHHAQVGHRRRAAGVDLHATRRQFIQRQAIALAQRAQLRAEKMALPDQSRHGAPIDSTYVKFTL